MKKLNMSAALAKAAAAAKAPVAAAAAPPSPTAGGEDDAPAVLHMKIERDTHRELRRLAFERDTTIKSLVTQAVADWLRHQKGD